MAAIERLTLAEMFRAAPLRTALVTLVPLGIALMQLANSAFNGLPFAVSVPFALVIVGFACLLTQYSLARFQRQQREQLLWK